MTLPIAAAPVALSLPVGAAQVDDAAAAKITARETLIVPNNLDATESAAILKPVDAFYGWAAPAVVRTSVARYTIARGCMQEHFYFNALHEAYELAPSRAFPVSR
jgi:hypothetical protein